MVWDAHPVNTEDRLQREASVLQVFTIISGQGYIDARPVRRNQHVAVPTLLRPSIRPLTDIRCLVTKPRCPVASCPPFVRPRYDGRKEVLSWPTLESGIFQFLDLRTKTFLIFLVGSRVPAGTAKSSGPRGRGPTTVRPVDYPTLAPQTKVGGFCSTF